MILQRILYLLLLIVGAWSARVKRIVGGVPAAKPPRDDPVVFVKHNGKFARVEGFRHPNEYHYHFRGLRFAEPPTSSQRFQRPRSYTLEGDIDATKFPPPCLQPEPGTDNVIGSEDCLFLNVFTPDLPDGTEGLPVILWIHGGGFRYGSASQYNVQHLVNKKIVLVTIQYRLGSLGFLSTGDRDMPGNAGLFDMAMAVQWTRHYIGFFGGNPHQITVMGHGTGASSALIVCLSNIAKGLTSAVVAMSGTATSNWAIDNEPRNLAINVAEGLGCPTTNVITMIQCLRSVKAADIIKSDSTLERKHIESRGFISGLSGLLTPAPVCEGRNDGRSLPGFLELKPLDALTDGKIPNIPLLTGVTRDETKRAVNGHYRKEVTRKLGTIPNFLDKEIPNSLQHCIKLPKEEKRSNKKSFWSILDPLHFKNYLSVGKNNVKEAFSKISEATGDALFNLPAFLTANMWSKNNNSTFFYRFEHLGKSFKAHHFLQGVPIIGNISSGTNEDIIGHGDDLAYLFHPRRLNGTSLPVTVNETDDDKRVRLLFTDIIYKFVKLHKIDIDNKPVPHFTEKANNFIGISAKPKLLSDFRFCQIALWAGITERLQSSACHALADVQRSVENVLFDTANATGLGEPVKQLTEGMEKLTKGLNPNLPGNLLSFGNQMKPEKKNSLNFGGLLG